MRRSETLESGFETSRMVVLDGSASVPPSPRQAFIHSGFANQSYSRPRLSPLRRFSFQPVLQATQDRFPDHLETLGQGMTVGIWFDRQTRGRKPAGYTWGVETAGVNYALHVEGLKDPSGNALQPEDRVVSVADDEVFEVLVDTAPAVLLAVMDAADGVCLVFDEAVQSEGMAGAIELRRQGALLEGETSRVSGSVLKWDSTSTDLGGNFHLGGQYSLSVVGVEDLAGNSAEVAAMSFTHLAVEGQVLIARQAASESVPVAGSAYGMTTLFQGRTWHGEQGMYYYRARWYLPEGGVFGERDPLGYGDSADLYQVLGYQPAGIVDPFGLKITTQPRGKIKVGKKTIHFLNAGPLWDGYWAFLNKHADNEQG